MSRGAEVLTGCGMFSLDGPWEMSRSRIAIEVVVRFSMLEVESDILDMGDYDSRMSDVDVM